MLPRSRRLAFLVAALATILWVGVLAGPAAAAPPDAMDRKGGPLAAVLGAALLLMALGLGVGAWRRARGRHPTARL